MSLRLRHAFATCAVSALALGGAVLPSAAQADTDPACDNPDALAASVTQAQDAVAVAKTAFHAANRPMGKLVAAKRHEAKAELVASKAAVKQLRQQVRSATKADRKTLRAQLRAERRDVAQARNLLTEKRALLAAIKADRAAAKAQLKSVRAELRHLRQVQETCGS